MRAWGEGVAVFLTAHGGESLVCLAVHPDGQVSSFELANQEHRVITLSSGLLIIGGDGTDILTALKAAVLELAGPPDLE